MFKLDYFVGCTESKATLVAIQPGMGQGHHRPYGIHNNHPTEMKSVYFQIHQTRSHNILGRFNSRCQLKRKVQKLQHHTGYTLEMHWPATSQYQPR